MNTKIFGSLLVAGVSLSLMSCSDFLDTTPTNSTSDKTIWSKYEYAQLHANSMYTELDYTGGVGSGGTGNNRDCSIGLSESLTDLFKYGGYNYTSMNRIPSEFAYGGVSTLSNAYVDTYLGAWSSMYTQISKANQAISNLRNYGTFEQDKKDEIEAEFRFFRAYFYSILAKRYPKLILYTENLAEYQKDHGTVDVSEVYEFIYQDLKFAGEHLPVSTVPNGRVTSGVAYALMSRVMLYAERWQDAADAAKMVIDMGYNLNYSDIDAPFKAGGQGAIFQICYSISARTHQFDIFYAPGSDRNYGNPISGGYGTPTQEMVESFELKTGGFPDWEEWHTTDGTQATPPYAKLEPRFGHTVLYNGSTWKGRTIEPYVDGADGWIEWMKSDMSDGHSATGYYLRKRVDETNTYANASKCTKPFTFIRIAEVVLNYAEALYNLNRPEEAMIQLNSIRTRPAVALPSITRSGEEIMAAIRQERKVELAYEGHYYWDMRRWGLAHTAFTGIRTHGLKIIKEANGTFTYFYVECDDQNRNFPEKLYSLPIPQSELNNNKTITQIPAWN